MKSLTNNTLMMAMAMTLWATASMADEVSNLPMNSLEKDTVSASAAAYPAPLHALSHLDAQILGDQVQTEQELKAVGGGAGNIYDAFLEGFREGYLFSYCAANGCSFAVK